LDGVVQEISQGLVPGPGENPALNFRDNDAQGILRGIQDRVERPNFLVPGSITGLLGGNRPDGQGGGGSGHTGGGGTGGSGQSTPLTPQDFLALGEAARSVRTDIQPLVIQEIEAEQRARKDDEPKPSPIPLMPLMPPQASGGDSGSKGSSPSSSGGGSSSDTAVPSFSGRGFGDTLGLSRDGAFAPAGVQSKGATPNSLSQFEGPSVNPSIPKQPFMSSSDQGAQTPSSSPILRTLAMLGGPASVPQKTTQPFSSSGFGGGALGDGPKFSAGNKSAGISGGDVPSPGDYSAREDGRGDFSAKGVDMIDGSAIGEWRRPWLTGEHQVVVEVFPGGTQRAVRWEGRLQAVPRRLQVITYDSANGFLVE
jgi:hypothetical protein